MAKEVKETDHIGIIVPPFDQDTFTRQTALSHAVELYKETSFTVDKIVETASKFYAFIKGE